MKRAEPGWFLLTLAGLAAAIGSFLPFYTYTAGVDATVWNRGLFPTATLIPLLGFAIGLEALFVLVAGHEPRSPFLNFTWEQARLAVGAFMILLSLGYLLQDRAGGTLGVGYLVLSLSSLATFAGGVMTRRVQLARAPGEPAPTREPPKRLQPALSTVNRWRIALTASVVGLGQNVKKARLAAREQKERRTEAANSATVELPAETSAEIPASTAVEPPVETSPEIPTATASNPPAKTFTEIPTKVARETERASDDTIVEMPADPPPKATDDRETAAEPPEETTAEMPAITADPPEAKPEEKTEEKPDVKPEDPTRVAPLSAVPTEADPDAPTQPDGESSPLPSESTAKPAPPKEKGAKVEKEEDEVERQKEEGEDKQPATTVKDRRGPAAPG